MWITSKVYGVLVSKKWPLLLFCSDRTDLKSVIAINYNISKRYLAKMALEIKTDIKTILINAVSVNGSHNHNLRKFQLL